MGKLLLCIRPCFTEEAPHASAITVGKVYEIVANSNTVFTIVNDNDSHHHFTSVGEGESTGDLEYSEELDYSYPYYNAEFFYLKMRGKCKESCDALVAEFPNQLKLVRGYYHEPAWPGKEQHWWMADHNGKIHDPTSLQFPSKGVEYFEKDTFINIGAYEEFDGFVNCEECGRKIAEKDIVFNGRYALCSDKCALRLVGLNE